MQRVTGCGPGIGGQFHEIIVFVYVFLNCFSTETHHM